LCLQVCFMCGVNGGQRNHPLQILGRRVSSDELRSVFFTPTDTPPPTHPPPTACTVHSPHPAPVNISAWRPSLLPRTLAHKDARMSRLRHHGHGGDLVSIPSRFVTDTLRDKTLLEQNPFCKSAVRQPSLYVTMHPVRVQLGARCDIARESFLVSACCHAFSIPCICDSPF
jgi:hypothetical protein